MTDKELIQKIANLWVDNDGDAEGLDYCYKKIKEKIQDLKEAKK